MSLLSWHRGLTTTTVEILHASKRVASHRRASGRGVWSTQSEHRPASHQKHLEWTPSRVVSWAETIGPQTTTVVGNLLETKPHPEQGYRSCMGIMRLGKRYGTERLEAAAARAIACRACTYKSIESILKRGLDSAPVEQSQEAAPTPSHSNLRGPGYFAGEGGASC